MLFFIPLYVKLYAYFCAFHFFMLCLPKLFYDCTFSNALDGRLAVFGCKYNPKFAKRVVELAICDYLFCF